MNKVINFHLVNNLAWFDNMICYLKSKYKLVSADTLYSFYSGEYELKNSCHITVDDGDNSFYEIIFPVLKKYNVPASLFVSPKICGEKLNFWFQEIEGYDAHKLKLITAERLGTPLISLEKFSVTSILKTLRISQIQEVIFEYQRVTGTPPKPFQNMTIENLVEVDRSGLVSVGAHTLNHPILKNEDDVQSRLETVTSVERLARLLEHEINYFAYPNGIPGVDFTKREQNYLTGAGIKLTFSTEAKNLSLTNSRMSIPRVGVSNAENMLFLKSKLSFGSPWDTLKKLKPGGEFRERKLLDALLRDKHFN